jgi:hypothetical protein
MIPKKIHYCWFGGNSLPESFQICLESWKKYLPDYEIIKWNESNFDLNSCEYVRLAAEQKHWAFVSDYARALALYEHGGIYMDIDVEVKLPFDEFLQHRAFSGFEIKGSPFTAVWGSEKGHPWPKKVVDFYEQKNNFDLTTNTVFVSDLLINEYKIDPNRDELQFLDDGIVIYPSTYFCLDLPKNYATHHFIGTWHKRNTPNPFKDYITTHYILNLLKDLPNGKKEIHNIFQNKKSIDSKDILDQIPFKVILKYLWRKIKSKIL